MNSQYHIRSGISLVSTVKQKCFLDIRDLLSNFGMVGKLFFYISDVVFSCIENNCVIWSEGFRVKYHGIRKVIFYNFKCATS